MDDLCVVSLPEDADFDAAREHLRERLLEIRERFAGRSLRLDLGARELVLFDVRRLVTLIREEFQAELTGLYVRGAEIHRYAEREMKLRVFATEPEEPPTDATEEEIPQLDIGLDLGLDPLDAPLPATLVEPPKPEPPKPEPETLKPEPSAAPTPKAEDPGRRTLSVQRTLRSGSSVQYDGDVVLFGDVNPGAQIVASGNIVVLGSLKGMVHAGATGDEECFIIAFSMKSTQLRIGKKIAIPPEDGTLRSGETEIARVAEGTIVIEPYRGKFK